MGSPVALCCVPGAPTPPDNSGSEVPVEFAQKPRFAMVADRPNNTIPTGACQGCINPVAQALLKY
jgi:hypothetical protein